MANFYSVGNYIYILKKDLTFFISGIVILIFLLSAIFAPLISGEKPIFAITKSGQLQFPVFYSDNKAYKYKFIIYPINKYNENTRDTKFFSSPPSLKHFFGTDQIGRDIFARVIYGTRPILKVGIYSTVISILLGFLIGFIIISESILSKFIELIMNIFNIVPPFFLLILIITINGRSVWNIIIAIVITRWAFIASTVKRWGKKLMKSDFIQAARLMGRKSHQIFIHHIVPNVTEIFLILTLLTFSFSILMEVSLSFLGIGVKPPHSSLGTLIAESWDQILSGETSWWTVFFPCLMLLILFISMNIFIEKLNAVFNPERNLINKK